MPTRLAVRFLLPAIILCLSTIAQAEFLIDLRPITNGLDYGGNPVAALPAGITLSTSDPHTLLVSDSFAGTGSITMNIFGSVTGTSTTTSHIVGVDPDTGEPLDYGVFRPDRIAFVAGGFASLYTGGGCVKGNLGTTAPGGGYITVPETWASAVQSKGKGFHRTDRRGHPQRHLDRRRAQRYLE